MLTADDRLWLNESFGLSSARNTILDSAMVRLRVSRPIAPKMYRYTVRDNDGLAGIWINSDPCRFSKLGRCTTCNWGAGQRLEDSVISEVITEALASRDVWPSTLVLSTCGSVLDPAEISHAGLCTILARVDAQTDIRTVLLETHLTTVTEEGLRSLSEAAPHKELKLEVGIESLDRDVLFYCMNRPPHREPLQADRGWKAAMDLKVPILANVLLGAPFLTPKERIENAATSAKGLLSQGAAGVVLFPVNIKRYTLPHWLYVRGDYVPVSLSEVLLTLFLLPPTALQRTTVAWYRQSSGNRESFVNTDTVAEPPRCPRCGPLQEDAISAFNRENDPALKASHIDDAVRNLCSDCRALTGLIDGEGSLRDRLSRAYRRIATELTGTADCP